MANEQEIKRIPSDIFSSILLDEIAQSIRELKKTIQQTIPEGVILTYDDEEITSSPKEFRAHYLKPWFSVSILNKGPNPVYVGINVGHGGGIKIDVGETFPVDFNAPRIKFVTLWCDKDQTTKVKITALY
jgi:hypothetical protein